MTDESMLPANADTDDNAETSTTTTTEEKSTAESFAWFWDGERQGEGDPPEWFKADKYKSVADQAKAYTEAEKRLGAFKGAPEEYELKLPDDFGLPEGVDVALDKEDPLLQQFMPWAKENNLSQDAFQDIVGMYVNQQAEDYQAAQQSVIEQKEQLGDNADKRLNDLAKWGKTNLDPEMYQKFADSLTTAAAVEAFEFIVGKTRNAPMPDPSNINPGLMSGKQQELKELQGAKDDKGQLKWFTDPTHRAKIEAIQNEIYGKEPYRKIVG